LKTGGGSFVMGQQYSYYGDGRLSASTDLTNSNLNRGYGYDQAGRLSGGTTANGSLTGPYSQTYGYDAWDNMNNRSWRTFYYNQYCHCMAPTTRTTIDDVLAFAREHRDGRYLVEVINPKLGPAWTEASFDAGAIN